MLVRSRLQSVLNCEGPVSAAAGLIVLASMVALVFVAVQNIGDTANTGGSSGEAGAE
jgi:hypothetical protein